jgi:hypothetical protein
MQGAAGDGTAVAVFSPVIGLDDDLFGRFEFLGLFRIPDLELQLARENDRVNFLALEENPVNNIFRGQADLDLITLGYDDPIGIIVILAGSDHDFVNFIASISTGSEDGSGESASQDNQNRRDSSHPFDPKKFFKIYEIISHIFSG